MANGIVWYGERGIVNALVADLSSRGEDGAAVGVRNLLRAGRWGDGGQPAWTDGITRVTFLVEVGAAQFGNPDLILDCECGPDARHAVLIEAKVIPYLGRAMSNVRGMVPGYNSSINGQLALRYRLAHALARPRGRSRLIEPAALHTQYRDQLADPTTRPRRLSDVSVCGILDHLRGLPPDHYHLVAWTWDREPFFDPAAGVPADLRPRFLAPDGTDAWDSIRGRVGWLGFEAVERSARPGHTYDTARRTMLAALAPAETVLAVPAAESLAPAGLPSFSAATQARVGRLADLAVESFGAARADSGKAVSLTFDGIVQGKVTPWWEGAEERVLVGIRSTLSPQDWWPARADDLRLRGTGKGAGYGVFYFIRTPADEEGAEQIAGEVFEMIADRVGG